MRTVVIIGNSGAARECYWLLRQVMSLRDDLAFRGFLSFNGYPADLRDLASFHLGTVDIYQPKPEDIFVIGIGHPGVRWKNYIEWKGRVEFLNLIHPSVHIPASTKIGEANVIAQDSFISCNINIGNANFINNQVALGHDAELGDANFLGPFSVLLGGTSLGHRNRIAVRTTFLAGVTMGNENATTPGSVVYKGCTDNTLLSGNPAFQIDTEYHVL